MQSIIERCFLVQKKAGRERLVIGIAGYPGAGKSTLAKAIVETVNVSVPELAPAIVVPMDGFHLSNEELNEMGLLHLKGIPETFDSRAFVSALTGLKETEGKSFFFPLFDRSVERSTEDAIEVKNEHRLIVVEGNYLLVQREPWNRVRDLIDEIWFLDAELSAVRPRLIARHIEGGRSREGAIEKTESTDLPNARLIESTRPYADAVVYSQPDDDGFLYRLEPAKTRT